jgi:hypothetical protein
MRGFLLSLTVVLAVLIMAASKTTASPISTSSTIFVVAFQQEAPAAPPAEAQQAPSPAPNQKIAITVDQHPTTGGGWYPHPVWMAIGALAALVVLLLIVMIAKAGETTVIHD